MAAAAIAVAGCALVIGMAAASRSPAPKASRPEDHARAWFLDVTDLLLVSARQLERDASIGSRGDFERTFALARDRYKRIEAVADFSFPGTARAINGPPVERTEDGSPSTIIQPEGFQLLEELMREPELDTARLRLESAILVADITRLRRMAATLSFSAPLVFGAARQELARVTTYGLLNADSPIARRGATESIAALEGVVTLLQSFRTDTLSNEARRRCAQFEAMVAATNERLRGSSADEIDYSRVIPIELRATAFALDSLRRALDVRLDSSTTALWRSGTATVLDVASFDPAAFAPRDNRTPPAARVDLGRQLFFDPVLSGDQRRSCASCHDPRHAFADPRPASPASGNRGTLARNAPSLINAALQPALFHDMRTAFLEDQAIEVIRSPVEMNGSLDVVIARLSETADYRARFRAAFPNDTAIDRQRIAYALGAYVRALTALDSPFDRHLRGDTAAMTASARRGFNVFAGKGRCATCHFLPLTSGAVPPDFSEMEAEGLGVASRRGRSLDVDPGLAARTRFPVDSLHFRTPSLRNVALTAPYMHNGAIATLREVVDFYDGGGGATLGFDARHQTLPTDSLGLSRTERADLLAFLQALTDTVGLTARPRVTKALTNP